MQDFEKCVAAAGQIVNAYRLAAPPGFDPVAKGGSSPKPPPPPKPPLPPSPAEAAKSKDVRDSVRRRGYSSTVLTSGQGVVGPATTAVKSLLGQ